MNTSYNKVSQSDLYVTDLYVTDLYVTPLSQYVTCTCKSLESRFNDNILRRREFIHDDSHVVVLNKHAESEHSRDCTAFRLTCCERETDAEPEWIGTCNFAKGHNQFYIATDLNTCLIIHFFWSFMATSIVPLVVHWSEVQTYKAMELHRVN